ncbi:SNF2 helicase protein [Nocardioides sp. J9]|uniref:SNF2 helicase-associated domain-containing protein n=1 Tax=Nocardioides sp. J9 TaxID=935844 RepID=UPI0011A153AD|nr:SNF2 helicase-associated domain-containing protein [Nocardioides sp. J9]TWH04691.1 SNF2 helicase protein [Nocardioides sp. J9]
MSFVPVTGPATFRAGDEDGPALIEFTDAAPAGRSVSLPVRAALPVLSRAHTRDDTHPSVALLSGAALLGLRLVAAGKVAPTDDERPGWRVEGLDDADRDAVRRLAAARAHDGLPADDAARLVRDVLDAVADAMPRAAPALRTRPGRSAASAAATTAASAAGGRRAGAGEEFADRVRKRLAERAAREEEAERRSRRAELPDLVRVSLRVEADEEELVAGAVRVVLQVHDERDPLHVCDAALLWTGSEDDHGFGARARIHASIALRAAADVWPVLDRFLALSVPDQLTLDGEEISSLLERVGALREVGVDVHWPRSLGPELTTRAVLDRQRDPKAGERGPEELPLQESPFSAQGLFAFSWQVAFHGEPLTDEEVAELARAASPVVKLRGAWTVVDPTTALRARKRLIRKATGAQALAAALTGTTEVPAVDDEPATADVVVGASLLKVREQGLAPPPPPRAEARGAPPRHP